MIAWIDLMARCLMQVRLREWPPVSEQGEWSPESDQPKDAGV